MNINIEMLEITPEVRRIIIDFMRNTFRTAD